MVRLFDVRGEPVVLGGELARGGEGAIHALANDPSRLAKRYLVPPSPEKVGKLLWMVGNPPPGISSVAAWPTDLLCEKPGGPVVGFLMPRVTGHVPLHLLYNTASRRKEFPGATFSFLAHAALNCAIAFGQLHAHGHLAGDVNESNLLVSPRDATVRFIDCDSFQIQAGPRTYRCDVGVPLFTPPELQGQSLRDVQRTPTHEGFGLAVLLFQILFAGRHPFTGVYSGSGEMTPERAIREFRFAYGKDAALFQMAPPPAHVPFGVLPPSLTALFEAAFSPQAPAAGRPDAPTWQRELRVLLASLKRCPHDAAHPYPGHLPECPWCQLLVAPGVAFFVSVPLGQTALTFLCESKDLDPLRSELQKLQAFTLPPPPPPPPSTPPPEGLGTLAPAFQWLRRLGTARAVLAVLCCAAWGVLWFASAWLGGALLLVLLPALGVVSLAHYLRRADLAEMRFQVEHAELRVAEVAVNNALGAYRGAAGGFHTSAEAVGRRLDPLFTEYAQLWRDYTAEQRALLKKREAPGCDDHLRSLLIDQHAPQGFGRTLRQKLIQAGLVSVYDLLHHPNLRQVPGIGPKRAQLLLDWARLMSRAFQQDPSRALGDEERRALVLKHRQRQQVLRARMEAEMAPLRARAREIQARVPALRAKVEAAQRALAEKRANGPPSQEVLQKALQPRAWEGRLFWKGIVATACVTGACGFVLHGREPLERAMAALLALRPEVQAQASLPAALTQHCFGYPTPQEDARAVSIVMAGSRPPILETRPGWRAIDNGNGALIWLREGCWLAASGQPCTQNAGCASGACEGATPEYVGTCR